eukprot:gene12301-14426_t
MRLATTNSWSLSFRARDNPCLFSWSFRADPNNVIPRSGLALSHWNVTAQTKLPMTGEIVTRSAWQLYETGQLTVDGPHYYIVPTTTTGLYANTFGVGTAIVSAPIFWAYNQLNGIRAPTDVCAYNREKLAEIAKLSASMFTAASTAIMFLVFLKLSPAERDSRRVTLDALIMTLLYSMGTTMLSVNSQALWQHAPNTMFLSLGIFCLLKADRSGASRLYAALTAASLSAATFCRPTSAVYPMAVGAYLAIRMAIPGANSTRRQRFQSALVYAFVGAIFGGLFLYHNQSYFGSMFTTGQNVAATTIAPSKGVSGIWATPFLTGAAALFFSPSRGLFIHSPFLMFAPQGIINLRRHMALAPFLLGAMTLTYAASTFFDYWGGWTFGTRPLCDTMPIFTSLVALALPGILGSRLVSFVFVLFGLASIGAHVIGNLAYDPLIWNYQKVVPDGQGGYRPILDYKVIVNQETPPDKMTNLNIDNVDFRQDRLWNWSTSQLVFLYNHLSLARRVKADTISSWKAGNLN